MYFKNQKKQGFLLLFLHIVFKRVQNPCTKKLQKNCFYEYVESRERIAKVRTTFIFQV